MSEPTQDRLLKTILTILAPIFLPFANDLASARDAALAAVERMRTDPQADLLSIAQALAFGVVSINTLAQALKPDLDPVVLLRLTRSANSLSRTEGRHRRAVNDQVSARPPQRGPSTREVNAVQGETTKQPNAVGKPDAMPKAAAKSLQQPPTEAQPAATPAPSKPAAQPNAAEAQQTTQTNTSAAQPAIDSLSPKSLDALLNWTANFIDGKKDTLLLSNSDARPREAKGTNLRSDLMSSVAHNPLLKGAPSVSANVSHKGPRA